MATTSSPAALRQPIRGKRRQHLLLTTALQAVGALVLALPAHAQLAPNARPVGGVVVGGAASISRTPTATTINQATQRAAIDWQGFDVGARQSVDFRQPNASAVALNRVTGPNPSQIAGRINANGQVILQNQDGITFLKGAQINTAGLVATAAGIKTRDFMAGRMVFDQPAAAGAAVVNHGNITVRDAGIAALVAPQVANSGVIEANLGRVVLAGAQTFALDLYGDGLVSIDVNGAVRKVPVGPDGKPVTALVTNTGTILAPGGHVLLTAREAAGIVQNLVVAGGTVSAPTVAGQAGEVVLNGIGGSIVVAGALLAQGQAAGTTGGRIEVAPSGGVVLASTARLDASGAAGGGTVAVGTDLARAAGGPAVAPTVLSHDVVVSPGATIAADATARGNGGRVTVLSADSTVMDGAISARGGAAGGDGGFVEVSGQTLGFDGDVNVGAPKGRLGTILFDPGTLDIINGFSVGAGTLDNTLITDLGTILVSVGSTIDTVSNFAINQIGSNGNVLLQASTLIDVQAAVSVTNGLTLQSAGDMLIEAGITAGALEFDAGRNLTLAGVGVVPSVTAGGNVVMNAGTAGGGGIMTLDGPVTSQAGGVFLSTGNGGTIAVNDAIAANAVSVKTDTLTFGPNATLSTFGVIAVAPATPGNEMSVGGTVAGAFDVPVLPVPGGYANIQLGAALVPSPGGGYTNAATTAGTISFDGAFVPGSANGIRLTLDSTGPVTQTAPLVGVSYLFGTTGPVSLTNPGNQIADLGPFTASGPFQLVDGESLDAAFGTISASGITLDVAVPGGTLSLAFSEGGSLELVVPTRGTISLEADNLTIAQSYYGLNGPVYPRATLSAPGGVVAIAPFTSGRTVSFAETTNTLATGLLITAGDLASIQPGIGTLVAGQASGQTVATAGSIYIGESLSLTNLAGALELDTTGPITQAPGATITVGQLTGSAGQVTLDQANAIGTLGAFDPLGSFLLNDVTPLVVAGPLTAGSATIAAIGSLTLAGNIIVPNSGNPAVNLSVGANSAGTASFVQTGAVAIGGATPNGGTLTVGLPASGGAATFSDLAAPGMQLVLALGSGVATGRIVVGGLLVQGQGGSATLVGSVAGNATPTAALISSIVPRPDPAYTMNGCEIAGAFCVLPLPPQVLTGSLGNLLPVIAGPAPPVLPSIGFSFLGLPPTAPDQLTNPDVDPPNISNRDY